MKTRAKLLYITPLLCLLLLQGCKATKTNVSKPPDESGKNAPAYQDPYAGKSDDELNATQKYIKKYRDLAISEMKRSKVPASITLAQGILESASGNSYLATKANNHFGIKCGKDWKGESIYFDDDQTNECFRKYKTVQESFIDHSDYLTGNARYAALFQLDILDYKGWAKGLKEAGYATRRNYAELLIDLIEKNQLTIYDVALPKGYSSEPAPVADQQFKYNGIPAIQAKQGDTYALIAKRNGISLAKLLEYNDLTEQKPLKEGQIVYLAPKKTTAKESYHIVRKEDRMYSVSQEYGIKLASLYEKNLLKPGEEPAVGEILYLRQKRTEPAETRVIKPEEPVAEQKPVVQEEEKQVTEDKQEVKENVFEEVPVVQPENQKEGTEEPVEVITPETKTVVVFEDEEKKPAQETTIKEPEPTKANEVTKESEPPAAVNMHVVQAGETLFSLSKKYSVSVENLKKWNNLTGDNISPGDKLIVGQGTTAFEPTETPEEPKIATPAVRSDTVFYVAQAGEDLYSIAQKNNTTVFKLISLNHLTSQKIYPGMKIIVSVPEVKTETTVPKTTKDGFDNPDALIIKKPVVKQPENPVYQKPAETPAPKTEPKVTASGNETYHIVQAGEGLFSIARKYGVTVTQIKQWNNLTSDYIQVGQKLIVGTGQAQTPQVQPAVPAATPQPSGDEIFHVVVPGETLFSISKKYGVSVESIKSLNNLPDNNIKSGQKLKIK